MIRRASVRMSLAAFLLMAVPLSLFAEAANRPEKIDFNRQIKPLLSDRCYKCHGPDEAARKAKLRLDQKEGGFKKLDDGMFVVKPGDLASSEVYRRITATDPDDLMPPPKSNLSLNTEEIASIKRWIEQGAEWEKHWSLVPLRDVPPPQVTDTSWPRNDIDRFVRARLEAERLAPSRPRRRARPRFREATMEAWALR